MSNIGNKLKSYRNELGLSLHEVTSLTGITNSRLSKIERGQTACPPTDLIKLANAYNKSLISLYLDAEYLSPSDLVNFQPVFSGVSLLDDEEKKHLQDEINFMNRKKETNYDI